MALTDLLLRPKGIVVYDSLMDYVKEIVNNMPPIVYDNQDDVEAKAREQREIKNWYVFLQQINAHVTRDIDYVKRDLMIYGLKKKIDIDDAIKVVDDFIFEYQKALIRKSSEKLNKPVNGYSKLFTEMVETVKTARCALIVTSNPLEFDDNPTSDLTYFKEERIKDMLNAFFEPSRVKEYWFFVPEVDIAQELWSRFKQLFKEQLQKNEESIFKKVKENKLTDYFDDASLRPKPSFFQALREKGILRVFTVQLPIFTLKPYIITDPNSDRSINGYTYASKNTNNISIQKSSEKENTNWKKFTWKRLKHQLDVNQIHEILPYTTKTYLLEDNIMDVFGLDKKELS